MKSPLDNDATRGQQLHRSLDDILSVLAGMDSAVFNAKDLCEVFNIDETAFKTWLKEQRIKKHAISNDSIDSNIQVDPADNKSEYTQKSQLFAEVKEGVIKIYKEVSADFLQSLLQSLR